MGEKNTQIAQKSKLGNAEKLKELQRLRMEAEKEIEEENKAAEKKKEEAKKEGMTTPGNTDLDRAIWRITNQKYAPKDPKEYVGTIRATIDSSLVKKGGGLGGVSDKEMTPQQILSEKRAIMAFEELNRTKRMLEGSATKADTTYFERKKGISGIGKPEETLTADEQVLNYNKKLQDLNKQIDNSLKAINSYLGLKGEDEYDINKLNDAIKYGKVDINNPLLRNNINALNRAITKLDELSPEVPVFGVPNSPLNPIYMLYDEATKNKEKFMQEYGLSEEEYELFLEGSGINANR